MLGGSVIIIWSWIFSSLKYYNEHHWPGTENEIMTVEISLNQRLTSEKIKSVNRVQILDEAVWVSHAKGMSRFFPPTMSEWLGRLVSLALVS